MDGPAAVLPPSTEAATTEDVATVAQREAGMIELSPLTPSALPTDATQQPSGNSPSSGSNESRRTSISWSSIRLPSISTFYSLGPKSSEYLKRYKTSIYKNLLKILGVFCGLGALLLAWIALNSPMKPNDIDIQSLAAMNRSAGSQIAIYQVLQESLSKLREELASERKQLEIDRELLRNEESQLDLQKWAAQRHFIKDCLEYQKEHNMTSSKCAHAIQAWDEPPPQWSEIASPEVVRRRPMVSSSSLDSSQKSLMTDDKTPQDGATFAITSAPMITRQEPPGQSPKEQPLSTKPDASQRVQLQYLDRFLTQFMMGFISFIAVSLILVYIIRLLRRKASDKKALGSRSEKTEPAETLPYDIYPAVIRNTAVSDDQPVGNRNRRATSTQYRKGDVWTAAYSGSLEAIASFKAENRYTNMNEISPRLGTPLQAACQGGQLETAKTLLKWGADPNAHGGRFKTCLVAAAYSGNSEVVRLVLDRSVSINEYNQVAGSALHAACERGSQEMVELLVANGADVGASGGSYGTPLQAASFRGNSRVVSLLLEKGAEAHVIGGQYGTPLHAAAVDGHVEASELLIEHGAHVNFKTETYGTALQVACQGDHTRLASVLIDHGASSDTLDEQSHTPLHHASRVGDEYLVETLLKRGAKVNVADADYCTALHYAASNGHTTVTELLLRYGADPSVQDKFGAQPLFRAAGLTYVEVVKMLIKAGAEVDAKDHYGKTALHGPFHDDNVEITELLLDAGANLNDRADDGKTPLHRAVEVANIGNLRLLLRRGADLNLEDNDQATPLLTAMKGDYKEVSREQLNQVALYLLQQPGIDVNSRSSAAFQEAIALNQMEVVEAMLAKKVSLNSQGWRCGGTVQAAVFNGSVELVSRLLNLGANANIQGGEFGTALQAAAFFGNTAVLDVLLEHGTNVNTRGGRFGYALTAARKGKAKLGVKAEIMRLLKQWGAKEGPVASTHEKERWTLTPSGWVWLPAGTYTVSQTTTIAVKDAGD